MLRQPIVVTEGHVDSGKTTLLDKIRGTAVASKEAGAITQHFGASYIPLEDIKKICGPLMKNISMEIKIPGLLMLDTPGHAAFTAIRKRGSSIADLAILVIDINEGFESQTIESLEFLKEFKTPFIIALTKIDKLPGWIPQKDKCFSESFAIQPDHVKQTLDEKLYQIVGKLSEFGFDSERFDRVTDYRKTVAIVPCSGITGEGIPEILMVLVGLSQTFLKDKIEITSKNGKGSILEVKEHVGLGKTIDVIIYDGEVKKGDWLIIGGKEPVVTKIKALLIPPAKKDIRVEKQFESIGSVSAAAGVKISAPNLEGVIAGSPIITTSDESQIEEIKNELKSVAQEIEFEQSGDGIILKADTLGSIEALLHMLKERNVPVKKAEVGDVSKKDIMQADTIKDPLKRIIIAFNVKADNILKKEAENLNIKILEDKIIYKIFEDYDKFIEEKTKEIRMKKLESITMPCKFVILKGMVFRVNNPAIVGVEILEGELKPGARIKKDNKEVGYIKAIQSEGVSIEKAVKGERVAVSIDGPTVGRQIKEGDILVTIVTKDDLKILEELGMKEELELGKEIFNL
ncbi:MAG: translation initiation factor IF-2 [Candidatus Aenigmarchaeota archaeon]|nr:translation initiation factor IF-2 [Candidatus Aenigmarchaeota archaeon]